MCMYVLVGKVGMMLFCILGELICGLFCVGWLLYWIDDVGVWLWVDLD